MKSNRVELQCLRLIAQLKSCRDRPMGIVHKILLPMVRGHIEI